MRERARDRSSSSSARDVTKVERRILECVTCSGILFNSAEMIPVKPAWGSAVRLFDPVEVAYG